MYAPQIEVPAQGPQCAQGTLVSRRRRFRRQRTLVAGPQGLDQVQEIRSRAWQTDQQK